MIVNTMSKRVMQEWIEELPFMQQSVLIAAVRGPDGMRKDHPVKKLHRFLRRSFLICAFENCAILDPADQRGGSFTGPSIDLSELRRTCDKHQEWGCDGECMPRWYPAMLDKSTDYLRYVDELPHHFQLHFMHASEILGYKHPDSWIKEYWGIVYRKIVNDAHLRPEPKEVIDKRLSDSENRWRASEEVTAQ